MSEFDIKIRQTQLSIIEMWNIEAQLSKLREDIDGVSGKIGFQMGGSYNIIRRLNAISDSVDMQRHDMNFLKNALMGALDLYMGTERKICMVTVIKDFLKKSEVAVTGPCLCVTDLIDSIKDKERKKKRINGELQRKGLQSEYSYEDGKWKKNNPDEKKADKKDTDKGDIDKVATLAEVEASISGTLYSSSGRTENENGYEEYTFEVGLAKANAQGYAGLYSVGPDGEKKFTPGVGGEIGIGVSLLSASGTALFGDDNFGAYASGEVTVGKAEAEIGGDIGIFDESGKWNPQAQVSASAEAIAAEAEVTGGVKAAGVDISGSAGINVGIGAHADFGFKDGKIKVDVGASLGVGVSLDFEIDVGQAVKNVGKAATSTASSAWEGVTDFFGW